MPEEDTHDILSELRMEASKADKYENITNRVFYMALPEHCGDITCVEFYQTTDRSCWLHRPGKVT